MPLGPIGMPNSDRQIKPLTPQEALIKLGSVPVGRVLFTRRGLPAVRFVNHVLDHGNVIIRDHNPDVPALSTGEPAPAVGYETDDIDPATHTGWSVTISGPATLIEDPRKAACYRDALRPWAAGETDHIISIRPRLVTGYEIIIVGVTS